MVVRRDGAMVEWLTAVKTAEGIEAIPASMPLLTSRILQKVTHN
jgi:hypothetical protein